MLALIYRSAALTIWLACIAVHARAQTFAELEHRLGEHPSLQALGFQAEADRERAVAARALPDPVVTIGVNNLPLQDPSFDTYLPTHKAIGVRQQFPSGAERQARSAAALGRVAETDVMGEARFAQLRRDLIVSLIDKQRIARQQELLAAREAKLVELIGVVDAEVSAGRPAVFRLAEIEADRAVVATILAELTGQMADADARLIELVGDVPATPPPKLPALEWSGDVDDFYAVRIAAAAIVVSDAAVDQAAAAWKPEWGVQLTYQQREPGNGRMGSTFAGDDWVSAAVTFNIPLWGKYNKHPALRAAQANRQAARSRLQAAARTAAAEYSQYRAVQRAADASYAAQESQVLAIENRIKNQLAIYESGVGDYAPIIDGEIAILKLRADQAAASARSAAAIASRNALLGQP
ncbi:MAG: TolC family protein [Pseudomonadales bacterium]|nr:TolC family protein [Pseudomonadales bacterium]